MSTRKAATLRAVAQRFVDGQLSDSALSAISDEDVVAVLTSIPGIGPWTAHGFLLVALDRPDVFLTGDVALRRALESAYGFDHPPTDDEMLQLAERWRPVSKPRGQLPVRLRIRRPHTCPSLSCVPERTYEAGFVFSGIRSQRRQRRRPSTGTSSPV